MPDDHLLYLLIPLAFLLGAALGSFVTLASWRLPRGEEIVFKPSYCPACAAPLRARDLVPLLSWVMARGRCRHCGAAVSPRYPLIELGLGLAFAAIAWRCGLSWQTGFLALLATELAILIVTDLEHLLIPDAVQWALLATGIAYAAWRGADPGDTLSSALFGLGLGLILHYGYLFLRKKDALGWGDVKFFFVAGVWLALAAWPAFLFGAGILGIVTGLLWRLRGRGAIFPFGPALAASLFINALFPDILRALPL